MIVGLGNPGKEYADTRHNLGRMVVQKVAERMGVGFKRASAFEALHAVGEIEGVQIDLLLPETYMNESGRAVSKFMRFFKLEPEQLFVVVDDAAIPFGAIRVRAQGSHGGHNGLKSIEAVLGSREYKRLRLGIGLGSCEDLADHVLERFSKEELQTLGSFIDEAAKNVENEVKREYGRRQ